MVVMLERGEGFFFILTLYNLIFRGTYLKGNSGQMEKKKIVRHVAFVACDFWAFCYSSLWSWPATHNYHGISTYRLHARGSPWKFSTGHRTVT